MSLVVSAACIITSPQLESTTDARPALNDATHCGRHPGITSKSSPAVFRPDWLGDTPSERVVAWGLDTRAHLTEIYRAAGSEAGIETITHLETYRNEADDGARPALEQIMDGFRPMTKTELACHHPVADGGWVYSSFMIEGSRYVPYLQSRAEALGLRVVLGTVEGVGGSVAFCRSASRLAGREKRCSLVVNATGLNGGPVSTNGFIQLNFVPLMGSSLMFCRKAGMLPCSWAAGSGSGAIREAGHGRIRYCRSFVSNLHLPSAGSYRAG